MQGIQIKTVLNSAAIDEVFNCTQITNEGGEIDYPFYWSGTTRENGSNQSGGFASYVSFLLMVTRKWLIR